MAIVELVHTHGRIVGYQVRRTTHYPHKAPARDWEIRVSVYLINRAERKAGHVPGKYSPECAAMHKAERDAYRKRKGLPVREDECPLHGTTEGCPCTDAGLA